MLDNVLGGPRLAPVALHRTRHPESDGYRRGQDAAILESMKRQQSPHADRDHLEHGTLVGLTP